MVAVQIKHFLAFILAVTSIAPIFALPAGSTNLGTISVALQEHASVFMSICSMIIFDFVLDITQGQASCC
jgi:hypothetical protein